MGGKRRGKREEKRKGGGWEERGRIGWREERGRVRGEGGTTVAKVKIIVFVWFPTHQS